MGHRFSKTAANNIAAAKTSTWKTTNNNNNNNTSEQLQAFQTTTNIIPIPNGRQQQQQTAQFVGPTINLQIQENPNITDTTGTHCIGATTSINSLTTTAAANSNILQIPQQQQQYNTNSISSSSLTSVNNLSCGGRQIIIKIQLAKMENGNETTTAATATTTTTMAAAASSPSASLQYFKDTSLENLTADCNLNSTESSSSSPSPSTTVTSTTAGSQVLNLSLNSGNSSCNSNSITATAATTSRTIPTAGLTSLFPSTSTTTTSSSSASSASTSNLYRTAGSSLNKNNNNNYFNTNSMGNNHNNSISSCSVMPTTSKFERPERLNSSLQLNDEIVEQNIGEIVEYCEVLEQQQPPITTRCNNTQMLTIKEETDNNEPNACCRRKSKSLAANGGNGSSTAGSSTNSSNSSSNTGTKAKSRCRKCSCRDAFRRFLDPSLSRSPSSNKAAKQQQQKEQKRNKSQDRHSTNNNNNTTTINNSLMNNNSMHSNNTNISARPTTATTAIVMPSVATNQVSLWTSATATPHGNDVIIPLTTPTPPQFVVVQCAIVNASNSLPPTPNTIMSASSTSSNIPTNGLISIAHDISPTTSSSSTTNNEFKLCPNNNTLTGSQTTVHSQVDYVHYLVPDLERITNSSFYWGKMDRYEAERLLEGKPEGTFLLRDSAQEEFLFSVTFRKYGRSLHARIEQSGHRFSFDCHDPCVFTAPTVTGLLEHYKDPACVMFFEPMLTIPLHRKNCFSLQKLCRATIVSNTTYDGINELELPARLKAYLKEYHYKQKLRVKFNEPSYTIHCK